MTEIFFYVLDKLSIYSTVDRQSLQDGMIVILVNLELVGK